MRSGGATQRPAKAAAAEKAEEVEEADEAEEAAKRQMPDEGVDSG